ncbi:DUF397 domain-containing protein [Streptomyces nigrescens]
MDAETVVAGRAGPGRTRRPHRSLRGRGRTRAGVRPGSPRPGALRRVLRSTRLPASEVPLTSRRARQGHVAPHGLVPVRDSKDPDGPALIFAAGDWSSFVSAIKRGQFSA